MANNQKSRQTLYVEREKKTCQDRKACLNIVLRRPVVFRSPINRTHILKDEHWKYQNAWHCLKRVLIKKDKFKLKLCSVANPLPLDKNVKNSLTWRNKKYLHACPCSVTGQFVIYISSITRTMDIFIVRLFVQTRWACQNHFVQSVYSFSAKYGK